MKYSTVRKPTLLECQVARRFYERALPRKIDVFLAVFAKVSNNIRYSLKVVSQAKQRISKWQPENCLTFTQYCIYYLPNQT